MALLYVVFLFLHLYHINSNKAVYPTPYKFPLATFSEFLKCYIFLCNIADLTTAEATEMFTKWNTITGREELKETSREASKTPWRPKIPASAATHRFVCFEGGARHEDIEPYLMEEESFGDMGNDQIVIEDEGHSRLLTRENLKAIKYDRTPKDIQDWIQSLFRRPSNTTM